MTITWTHQDAIALEPCEYAGILRDDADAAVEHLTRITDLLAQHLGGTLSIEGLATLELTTHDALALLEQYPDRPRPTTSDDVKQVEKMLDTVRRWAMAKIHQQVTAKYMQTRDEMITARHGAQGRETGWKLQLGNVLGTEVTGVSEGIQALAQQYHKLLNSYPDGMTPTDVEKLKDANAALAMETAGILKGLIGRAAGDVFIERRRQVEAEGWTPERDDQYTAGDLASASACYATQGRHHYPTPGKPGPNWPWAPEWWKPSDYRRNLVKAGALLLAEIERLDRQKEVTTNG